MPDPVTEIVQAVASSIAKRLFMTDGPRRDCLAEALQQEDSGYVGRNLDILRDARELLSATAEWREKSVADQLAWLLPHLENVQGIGDDSFPEVLGTIWELADNGYDLFEAGKHWGERETRMDLPQQAGEN